MNRKSNYFEKRKEITGITGAGHGVGTTTLALMLLNYYSSYLCESSCIVELSGQRALGCFASEDVIISGPACGFSFCGSAYFPDANLRDLESIKELSYRHIILDLGTYENVAGAEEKCSRVMITGSLYPWRYGQYRELMKAAFNERPWILKQGIFTCNCRYAAGRKRFEKEFSLPIRSVPFIDDPFRLSRKDASEIASFLGSPCRF